MLQSVREERSRHFKLALRIGIPVVIFIFLLVYALFFREEKLRLTTETVVVLAGMVFAIVYFIFFALELSRQETLLDRITGSYHYDSFHDRVLRHRPRTLAVLKISNLSVINETYGVNKADRILKELVRILNDEVLQRFGHRAWIGRKNGAEFLLAVEEEPEKVQEELSRFFRAHPHLEGVEIHGSYAVIRNNIEDPDKAIEQLRDLLAQREGGAVTVPEEKVSDARQLSEEEQAVIDALERRDLFVQFRPLLNLETQRCDIYEIAVKMKALDGSSIAPKAFLPIINRHNLGEIYDLLILDRVLENAKLVDEEISLCFNLSPFSLRKDQFLEAFFDKLKVSGVTPHRLIVELYERRRHHQLEEYLKRLKMLKHSGVRLCLDNFGSSNASMEYLRYFPFDMIEFDREYTFDLESGKNASIFRSFIAMAKEMKILTAAKWVDNRQKVALLREFGVDYIQGYAAGKVLKEEEFIALHNPYQPEGDSV
ncbi:EAL domain-containing protein [Nitratifractor sp.]|uniref:EAL domain-containing protein n=1 Tax=Nitratifractor sp. TaxID=2268144 RepID=UPI0025DA1387|nr:GGDEF domain-containing protein [Nitratifractor sp.]